MKRWQKIVIGAVVLGSGVWWFGFRESAQPTQQVQKPVGYIVASDWTLGNPQAPVQIVEYSDFQCPACRLYNGVAETIVNTFGNSVGFAYRFFPLKQIHPQATLAAQAAQAAGLQGKFWEMARLLFENQAEWEQSNQALLFFASYAEKIGLDMNQFRKDIDSAQVKNVVESAYIDALVAKIEATPTFYINGQKINNLKGPDDLINRVRFTLEEATASASPSAEQ